MLVRNGTCMKCNTCGASYLSTGTPRDCYEDSLTSSAVKLNDSVIKARSKG